MEKKLANHILVYNRHEWLNSGWFTAEEIDNADENGLIGQKFGTDCYVSKWLIAEKHLPSLPPIHQ